MRKLFLAAMLVLAGCAQFENVTVDEIRSAEHKRAEGEIPTGLPEIQQALNSYGSTCESLGSLQMNPENPGRATYTGLAPGVSESSATLLIDLQQVGRTTRYQGYTYYKTGQSQLDKVLYVMGGGKQCKR